MRQGEAGQADEAPLGRPGTSRRARGRAEPDVLLDSEALEGPEQLHAREEAAQAPAGAPRAGEHPGLADVELELCPLNEGTGGPPGSRGHTGGARVGPRGTKR